MVYFRLKNDPIPFLIDFILPSKFAFFKFKVDFSRNDRKPAANDFEDEFSLADKSTSLKEASMLDFRLGAEPVGSTDALRRSLPIASLIFSVLNVSESNLKFETVCLSLDFFSATSGSVTFSRRW